MPVGTSGENVGIVAFNVRRYLANKMSYEVFIEVQNFGEQPAKRKLVLYSGDLAIDVKTIELKGGERQRHIYPNRGGGEDNKLRAELETTDGRPTSSPPTTRRTPCCPTARSRPSSWSPRTTCTSRARCSFTTTSRSTSPA